MPMQAHTRGRGIQPTHMQRGIMRWEVATTLRPLYPWESDPIPIVRVAGWAPGPVWKGAENLAPTGIRSPDRPRRNESLYQLNHLESHYSCRNIKTPLFPCRLFG
jgi:hypothetical protein